MLHYQRYITPLPFLRVYSIRGFQVYNRIQEFIYFLKVNVIIQIHLA